VTALSDDIIRGTEAIGREIGVSRTEVRNLIRDTNIPIFRLGNVTFARRSALLLWLQMLEWKALRRQSDKTA
jgi:hypothetical protein